MLQTLLAHSTIISKRDTKVKLEKKYPLHKEQLKKVYQNERKYSETRYIRDEVKTDFNVGKKTL